MSSTFDQSTFAATTMDTQSGEAEPASYGYLGRYRLDRMIGHGAMGAVFEAFDATLDRTIAIKTLYTQTEPNANGFDSETIDSAILQEARAAATLNHPHIVTVYDAGRAPSSVLDRELPYVAMELLQGIDLRQRIAQGPPLGQREAVALIGKLALALDHAHKSGVLHRDIKPANVFLSKANGPKILDFGLAKFTARAKLSAQLSNAPSSAVVAGSPQYMSPEMVLSINDPGLPLDLRSDVYSLGVILYELLCGMAPFSAPTLELLQQRIVKTPPEPPYMVNPTVPRDLSDIVLNTLEKNPEDRYRSAAQFARELRRWGAGHEAEAEADGTATARSGASRPAPLGASPQDNIQAAVIAKSNALGKPLLWAGWVSVLAVAAALGLWQMGYFSSPHASPVQAPATVKAPAPIAAPVLQPEPVATTAAPAIAIPATAAPASAAVASPVATIPTPASVAPTSAAPTSVAPASVAPEPTAAAPASPVAPVATTGRLRIAVTPWGEVEVDGKKMGVSPPLTALSLEPGEHTVVLRNSDFAARTVRLKVEAGKTEKISHKFE
jgi:eukaryotic-like serine/threonine-protein kinase